MRTVLEGAPAPLSAQLRFPNPWDAREFSAYLWSHKGSETRIIEEGCSLLIEKPARALAFPEEIICSSPSPSCLPSCAELDRMYSSGTSLIILIGGYGLDILPDSSSLWIFSYDNCRLVEAGLRDEPCGLCDVCTHDTLKNPAGLDSLTHSLRAFNKRFTRGELKNLLYSLFPAEGVFSQPVGLLSGWSAGEIDELIFSLERLGYIRPNRQSSIFGRIGSIFSSESFLSFDFDKKSFMDRYRELFAGEPA